MRGRLIAGAVALALLSLVAPAGAQLPIGGGPNPPVPVPIPVPSGAPPAEPYGTNDYGGFRDILPPGTNGLDNGAAARRVRGRPRSARRTTTTSSRCTATSSTRRRA